MLVSSKKILDKAHKGNYAVGAFNINNMEILQAVVKGAINMNSPVLVSTSEGAIEYAGLKMLYEMTKVVADNVKIPIALHLDHGRDFELIKKCAKIGYTSIMFDGSHLFYDENVKITKKVVALCHAKGIPVEAELGTIGGVEDKVSERKIIYTEPSVAVDFVNKTGCDYLAIAIGTSHGAYKFDGNAKLRIDILKEIKKRLNMPLVLHGASAVIPEVLQKAEKYGADLKGAYGVPESEVRMAIKNGINKVNTDTDLRMAFDAAVREVITTKPKDFDPRHILGPARDYIQYVVEHRIKVFGSRNKA